MTPQAVDGARVEVLLSTYNGARYLREQLDSVLAQEGCDVRLRVRDDGSSDETLAILAEYARRDARVRYVAEPNVGVVRSFRALIDGADPDAAFVAFCDQDDVWLPGKLARAVARLTPLASGPALYCARLQLVDAELRSLTLSPRPRRPLAFENALVENVATGCSVVLSRAGAAKLRESFVDEHVLMHDWWAYLVISAFGAVVYDDEPALLYRQHGHNVVGGATGVALWRRRVARFSAGAHRGLMSTQALAFAERCGERLAAAERRALDRFLRGIRGGPLRRLGYALTADVWRQRRLDSLILRCLIVLGRV